MLRGLYSAAFGMMQSQNTQDVTANNIANSSTPGFKQDAIVSKPFPEVMLQNMDGEEFGEPAVQKLGKMTFGVETEGLYTNFVQGATVSTGRDMDFSIEGRGFFPVRYFDGISESVLYTRDGSFERDSEGNVVTSEGGFLLAKNAETGEIGPMKLGEGNITVDAEGNVFEDSQKKYTLLINDFDDYNGLEKYGKNMYKLNENSGTAPREAQKGDFQIKQGSLEQSNVDMNTELTNMIISMRSYQANQRVFTSIDETLGKAVNQVGSLK